MLQGCLYVEPKGRELSQYEEHFTPGQGAQPAASAAVLASNVHTEYAQANFERLPATWDSNGRFPPVIRSQSVHSIFLAEKATFCSTCRRGSKYCVFFIR